MRKLKNPRVIVKHIRVFYLWEVGSTGIAENVFYYYEIGQVAEWLCDRLQICVLDNAGSSPALTSNNVAVALSVE